MSKNRNRAKLNNAKNNHQYRIIWINYEYPIYWDECINMYPRYNKGTKSSNKRLFAYQVRMYKTWKYNRKTRWK